MWETIWSAPNGFLLSVADFHFSSIDNRHFWALKSFLNPHWYLEKKITFKILWHLFKHDPFIWSEDVWQYTNCNYFSQYLSPFYEQVLYLPNVMHCLVRFLRHVFSITFCNRKQERSYLYIRISQFNQFVTKRILSMLPIMFNHGQKKQTVWKHGPS